MKLWVDNRRLPPEGFKSAHAVHQALSLLSRERFDELSLDYDLDRGKGLQVLTHAHKLPDTITLHTANPIGRRRMERYLKMRGYRGDGRRFTR